MMVDTGYSSDNNGVDPVFTNYTHSHIASVTVTMTRMLLMISFVSLYCTYSPIGHAKFQSIAVKVTK